MSFAKAISVIKYVLEKAGTTINMDDYDGAIVKKLAASNTLDEGRTTNQTHIAITGTQMDIFPYLCADGYFYDGAVLSDVDLKKYFVIRIPVTLYESNLKHLGYNGDELSFNNGVLHTTTSVVRSKRKGQSDQLQVSMLDMDGKDFVAFRKLMHTDTYFILLKRKTEMHYDAFGINTALLPGVSKELSQINNQFFKDSTKTVVDAASFNDVADLESIAIFKREQELIENTIISEEDFRVWLSQRIKKDGQLLSTTYQNAYYYILKAIPSMLGFESVFSITDPITFDQYRQKIEVSEQYQEANPNVGVGTLSAALTNYGLYLDERHRINIPAERLGQLLKEWCEKKYVENNITSTLVGFGFKYARAINKAKVTAKALLDLAKIESTMAAYIDRGKDLYAAVEKANIGIRVASTPTKAANVSAERFDYLTTKGNSFNKIFFGMPGCGKSYHIEHNILGKDTNSGEYTGEYEKENIVRTTFYQDYSNTDFVGQILPKVVKGQNGAPDTVEYIFNPGPFTLALIQAIGNPTKKVALVIEEINRGNAPAIFGDVFQLLDRDANSISEYGIVNVSLMDYLNDYEFVADGQKHKYIFTEIKIPGNMDIFATMNTSDQNVYTLDTAFVRRWDKEKIKNTFAKCDFKKTNVPGMDYTWQEFVEAINTCIASHLEDLQVNEDKQIGAFFVKESLLSGSAEKFAYKVFDYLWNDVAKLDHAVFFNHYDTLDALIVAYVEKGVAVFKPGIFKEKAATLI